VGHSPPHIFRTYSHLCFETRYHKQNSVIRLKSNILVPANFFGPDIFGLATLLPAGASCQTCERIVLLLVFIVAIITWQQIFKCSLQVTILGVLSHVTLERRHLGK